MMCSSGMDMFTTCPTGIMIKRLQALSRFPVSGVIGNYRIMHNTALEVTLHYVARPLAWRYECPELHSGHRLGSATCPI
jgi:hypothetical protein